MVYVLHLQNIPLNHHDTLTYFCISDTSYPTVLEHTWRIMKLLRVQELTLMMFCFCSLRSRLKLDIFVSGRDFNSEIAMEGGDVRSACIYRFDSGYSLMEGLL